MTESVESRLVSAFARFVGMTILHVYVAAFEVWPFTAEANAPLGNVWMGCLVGAYVMATSVVVMVPAPRPRSARLLIVAATLSHLFVTGLAFWNLR